MSTALRRYELSFAARAGLGDARAFWKGRVAFYAILKALRIGPGDEVIIPAFTCVVVPNAIRYAGATPVYVDLAAGSYNTDAAMIAPAVTDRTRAILVQHTFGIPVDLEPIMALARRHRLAVVEDCTHVLDSTYHGQPLGSFGDASFFSSQWSKPYTTGLGGLATTRDPVLAERLGQLQGEFQPPASGALLKLATQWVLYRKLFSPRTYWFARASIRRLSGLKLFVGSSSSEELAGRRPADSEWRMSAFQARVGLERLEEITRNAAHRRATAALYAEMLRVEGWPLPEAPPGSDIVYVRFPVRVGNKAELLEAAEQHRIELGSWFDSVLHPLMDGWDSIGYQRGQCATGEQMAREVVNLPLHSRVTPREARRTLDFLFRYGEKAGRSSAPATR